MSVGSLIPIRFLTLTAHLVITIVIFWSKVRLTWVNFDWNKLAFFPQKTRAIFILSECGAQFKGAGNCLFCAGRFHALGLGRGEQ